MSGRLLSEDEIEAISLQVPGGLKAMYLAIRDAQDAKSFPLGEESGIAKGRREVIELVRNHFKPEHYTGCYGVAGPDPECPCCAWNSHLKEWGL